MSRFIISTVSLFVLFSFQACSPFHDSNHTLDSTTSSTLPPGTSLQVDQNLQNQSLAILKTKCGSCHDAAVSGGVTQILNVIHLISSNLVTPGDPTKGRLIGAIADGSMPLGGSVSPAEFQTLKDWITSMKLIGTLPADPGALLPAGKTVQADMTLHNQAMTVLNVNCGGCHQGITSGGVGDILNINHLVATGLVTAGDPTKGRLIGAIEDGSMPEGNGANVTAADLLVIKNWIASMQIVNEDPNVPALPTRAALTPTFAGVFANIIQPKCLACHGPVKSDEGLNLNSYNAVKARTSALFSECQSGGMPRAPYPLVTAAELAAMQAWIQSGAPNN